MGRQPGGHPGGREAMTWQTTIAVALALAGGLAPQAVAQDVTCAMTGVALNPAMVHKSRAELSAVIVEPGRLLTISNEGLGDGKRQHSLQVFRGAPGTGYQFDRDIPIFTAPGDSCGEADFEGLASANGDYFAISSHSRLTPKKAKKKWSDQKAADKLGDEADGICSSRYQLRQFKLTTGGAVVPVVDTSLRAFIESHPVLRDYTAFPSKEGGIDIEGLAAAKDALYAGFRGPVIDGDLVPVLKLPLRLDPGQQLTASLRYVRLEGRGVRAMTAGPDGIYILAGPTGKEARSFALFRWDGADQKTQPGGPVKLCDLGFHDQSKPEGIALIDATAGMRFMLVFDGPPPLKAATITVPAGR